MASYYPRPPSWYSWRLSEVISDLSLSLFTFKDQPPSSHREIAPFTMQLALVKFGLYILSSQFIISANVYSVCSLCSCL